MVDDTILIDLNSQVFQRDLFALNKQEQTARLSTLKKIRSMTWQQVYVDAGLKLGNHSLPTGTEWATFV